MEIFNISRPAIISQILAFLILIWALKKYLFGPIGTVLEARQSEVQSTLDRIAADRQAMEQARTDYEQRIASVEAEAREKIQAAIKEAQGMKDEIVGAARTEADRMITRGRAEIEREKTTALAELRTEVADLVVAAAGKVLGRAIDERAHHDLIRDFVNQVGTS
jgi:F-type H+-transporting ATPase subunit b